MSVEIQWKTGNPPDELKKYLVTYKDGIVSTCIWGTVQVDITDGLIKTDTYSWVNPHNKIIAYAELPKPYKGD